MKITRIYSCIPNQVYDHLPDFLKRAMKPARSKRERDILLLGLIANLSGCLPQVRISFDQRPYSPQLYTLIIAPPPPVKDFSHWQTCSHEKSRII